MSKRFYAILILCHVFILVSYLRGQQDQGTITGIITDATGGAIPKATVTATETEKGASTRSETSADGVYTITPLKLGVYQVVAEATGFKRSVADRIQVHAQSRVRVDFRMQVGAVTEQVSVSAEAPLIEKETSSLSQVIGEAQIKGMPMNSRNFQQLAVLAAGVLPAFGHRDKEGGFNSHGQWATQNNFILDGVDNNSQVLGLADRKAQVLIPSLDAVQEFKIQTSNYSAEFGRNAGAVMSVSIKSGTNEFHGTAYEFLRNDFFDARSTFNYNDRKGDGKARPEVLRQNQFGFTFGGPVRKNKTFFFGSIEGLKIHGTLSSLVTVPTIAERQGIFDPRLVRIRDPRINQPFPSDVVPRARWDPTAARLIDLWPPPNFSGSGTRANYVSERPYKRNRYQYDTRMDHNFSDMDNMFVRFSWMDFKSDQQGSLPIPAVGAPNNETSLDHNAARSLAVSETHVFSPSWVNEFRFGFNRLTTDKNALTNDFPNERFGLNVPRNDKVKGLARLTFGGAFGYVALGEAGFIPNYKLSQTFQFLDNLSIIRGGHNVKLGTDIRWIQSDILGAPQTRGVFAFNGRYTGSSLGDFLLGMTNTRQYSTFQEGDLRERDYMFYLQDDWKISPRLTLNLGLRYELSSPMFDTKDRMTTLDVSAVPIIKVVRAGERGGSWSDRALVRTDKNNWAPRLGFAYQLSTRWTVRAAGGVFYGTTGGGLGASSRLINNWPHYREVTQRSTPTRSAGRLQNGIDASFLGDTTVMPPDLNWNVWAEDFKLPTIYQWNAGVQKQLTGSMALTLSYVGSSSNYLPRQYNINGADIGDPSTERLRRLIPTLGNIDYREPSGHSTYHGFEATLDKRLSRRVQFSLAYTWSHSIDDVPELFGDEGGVIQDKRNLRADRGDSGFDRRQRLAGSYLLEVPLGKGRYWMSRGGLLDYLFGGWLLSGIVSLQSGSYFDVTVPNPTTFLGVSGSAWRADLIGDPSLPNPTAERWFNTTAFAVPRNPDGSYLYGNMGRNVLPAPGFFSFDLGLMKNVAIRETKWVQLRWEVFNATNHPSYGRPNANISSVDFGKIRSTIGNPRQMQFAVKFIF